MERANNVPYIKEEDRNRLQTIDTIGVKNAGELNYLFTRLALNYITDNGEKYQNYNDIIGALEGAKLELYRRHVSEYENYKILTNGDVKRGDIEQTSR